MSLRLVVLISGSGSNLQAILEACGQVAGRPGEGQTGGPADSSATMDARVVGVLSNRDDAYGLTRARQAGVDTAVLAHTGYPDRESFDAAMAAPTDRLPIARVFDAASGMFGARLEIKNDKGLIPGGIRCQVSFPDLPTAEAPASLQDQRVQSSY